MSQEIDIADRVHHTPSGEDWVIAKVYDKFVMPAGWPESTALASDCTLIRKATAYEREFMIAACRRLPERDSRHIKAE